MDDIDCGSVDQDGALLISHTHTHRVLPSAWLWSLCLSKSGPQIPVTAVADPSMNRPLWPLLGLLPPKTLVLLATSSGLKFASDCMHRSHKNALVTLLTQQTVRKIPAEETARQSGAVFAIQE